jgi:hypothetical protein
MAESNRRAFIKQKQMTLVMIVAGSLFQWSSVASGATHLGPSHHPEHAAQPRQGHLLVGGGRRTLFDQKGNALPAITVFDKFTRH